MKRYVRIVDVNFIAQKPNGERYRVGDIAEVVEDFDEESSVVRIPAANSLSGTIFIFKWCTVPADMSDTIIYYTFS